ncbi:MAG: thymidine phosphorylase [Patescibacteria group bacterium]|nr:thymidine phosphorylase [Patescibacteria group bacterium]MDD5715747.1 thymidine phosphorylase [Patescibacteria group bacterium]
MPFFLRARKLDFSSGGQPWVVVLQEDEARSFGIVMGDLLEIRWKNNRATVIAYYTRSKVRPGQIGFFKEIWKYRKVRHDEPVSLRVLSRPPSIEAIRKKLLGEELSYQEMRSIISDIVHHKLGKVETTYFVASSFVKEFSDNELYFMTKAMAETGETLKFPGKVIADKHSVGGVAGNRTTMVVVPIVASLGVVIPKTSSRAITSPAGTADTMEVLANVSIPLDQVQQIIKKINCCLIWGGSFRLAPADDYIIRVQHSLRLEPLDKMVVSIMAKKIAMGVTHLVVDLPYGTNVKVPTRERAISVKTHFEYLAKRFGIKIEVVLTETSEPVGRGIGPALEARDVLRVLQQKDYRPSDLQKKSVRLAAKLLELAGKAKPGKGHMMAVEALSSGKAWKKMQEIITAQGGNPDVDSEDLTMAAMRSRCYAPYNGKVLEVDDEMIDQVARILGAPHEKLAGIYINKHVNQRIRKGERLYTLYAQSQDRIDLALEALRKRRIFKIVRVTAKESIAG